VTRRPLFPIALAWVLGTLAGACVPSLPLSGVCTLAVASAVAWAAFGRCRRFLLVALACVAAARAVQASRTPGDDILSFASSKPVEVVGVIATDPDVTAGRTRFRLKALTVRRWGRVHAARGVVDARIAHPLGWRLAYALEYGDWVRLRGRLRVPGPEGNPGEFPYRAYLAAHGVAATLSVTNVDDVAAIRPQAPLDPKSLVLRLKRRWQGTLRRTLPADEAAMANGLLFSSRSALPNDVQESFVRTGTVHLLSASGAHVAALAGLLILLAGLWRRGRKVALLTIMVVIAAYAVMAGGSAAVNRAALMCAVYWGAELLNREPDASSALCFAAIALLAASPLDVLDVSFQLSFAAALGLVLLGSRLGHALASSVPADGRVGRSVRWVLSAMGVSLAAEAGIGPVVLIYYQQLSLISPLANLIAVPLAGAAVIATLAHAAIGSLWWPAGQLLAPLSHLFLSGLLGWVSILAAVPWAMVRTPPPNPLLITAFYAAMLAVARPWALRPRPAPASPPPAEP